MDNAQITLEQLTKLGMERLAALVIQECQEQPQFEQRVQHALAAISDPKGLISLVKKQLASLSRGKKFYSAGESFGFAQELTDIQQAISKEVAAVNIEVAIELARKFLSLHRKVFERVDDSYGNIWPIFNQAVGDLAGFYQTWGAYDRADLAKDVFDWYCHNDYGVYDNAIKHFAPVLGTIGCTVLEKQLRQYVEQVAPTAKHPDFARTRGLAGLRALADAHQDVEGYIAVLETYDSPVGAHHKVEIAERLIQAHRYADALNWLNTIEPSGRFDDDKRSLAVQALTGLGQTEAAQAVRIEQFTSLPSETLYQDCLDHAEDPDGLREQLLGIAMAHTQKTRALSCLVNVGALAQAAALVRHHRGQWDGHNYYALQPAAKALEQAWPLEATILYRALIEDIVSRAQSKYYRHAVRYLRRLEALAPQIENWAELSSHEPYFAGLQEAHKRKKALWNEYSR